MNSNTQTLSVYQAHFQNYIDGTVQVTTEDSFQGTWIKSVLDRIPKTATILEIGSAFGRDASFITRNGYENIDLTDAFQASVDYLRTQGFEARLLNVLTDELGGEYDLIFASAVFLHFNDLELKHVLSKLKRHILTTGYLAFSVKQGEGEEWTDKKMGAPRYFYYWTADKILSLLRTAGYDEVDIRETDDKTWLCVTARLTP